jgi:transcriptional regulator with XRE-family HTH domain
MGNATGPPPAFAAALREARAGAGLTQAALARRAGCHFAHLSRLEAGTRRPSAELVERLARALRLDDLGAERLRRAAGVGTREVASAGPKPPGRPLAGRPRPPRDARRRAEPRPGPAAAADDPTGRPRPPGPRARRPGTPLA